MLTTQLSPMLKIEPRTLSVTSLRIAIAIKMKSISNIFKDCERVGSWYGETISSVSQKNFMGDTILHTVANRGEVESVLVVIKAGADVNALGDQGNTPLFNAVSSENIDAVLALLRSGANVNIKNNFGRTVLEFAKNIGASEKIVAALDSSIKGRR